MGVLAGVLVFSALTVSGYANSWYADGALAASRSWKAFFDNAADLSGVVSIDKGPLSDWMMGLSGRTFGFSSFSMLLPDALLALLLVASAWALVRALESGRLRHMLLCGAFVGLAFNTKMLEAYMVVPGLAGAFAVAGRGGWRRRLGHLLSGGAVMVVVSFAWFTC